MLPPIPSWDGLHPLVVHFPIALLMVAPLFILAGIAFRGREIWPLVSALTLMVLGTLAAFVAVSTGEAAAELVMETAANAEVLDLHEELAEKTQVVFAILTGIYALLVILPAALKRPLSPRIAIIAHSLFLLVYAGALLLLVNTAHQGGLLVHQHGVRAKVAQPVPKILPATGREAEELEREKD
jgi:uncharacterized membrane protein